jgi:hypothetical protein
VNSFSRSSLVLVLVVAAGLIGVAAPTTSAQCFGPDQLDVGPCCGSVLPNLPSFPPGAVPGLGICWDDCAVIGQQDVRVQWSPPSQIFCGEYISQLTVLDPSGAPLLSGALILDYTRTWIESSPTGIDQQVWRFAVKVDLSAVAGGTISTCLTPSCIAPIGPHPTAFYYGYLDYTSCPGVTPWENALVLYHACDKFVHTPGFSDRPGVFHPTGEYAIVAPHSTLQPFVPMDLIAPGGPLVAEATRNVISPTPSACVVEDRVVVGDMTPLGAGCLCPLSSVPKHQTAREFKGTTACVNPVGIPGGWTSLNILCPTLPWFQMITTSIGCWTNPAVYPGDECAWVDEGLFITQDACSGDFVEVKYGGSTSKGWPVIPTWSPVTQDFTDLADNYSSPLAGPHSLPLFGSVQQTDHLVYVNLP